MTATKAFAAFAATTPLGPLMIERRAPEPQDVTIEIDYCGICHSDLHVARSEWEGTVYPCVPGHEMIGRVTGVGPKVTKFQVGQRVGVGVMVESCGQCACCTSGKEQYCLEGYTGSYNVPDKRRGGVTYGGYSASITVHQHYVMRVPEGLDPAAAAPLLCAGITLYSPLKHWGAGPGKRVGVAGLGGLGHVGVKIARAMGATVVMLTTSQKKAEDALRLGAHEVIISTDEAQMKAAEKSLDLIMNTIAATHDYNAFTRLLRVDGTQVLLGVPPDGLPRPDTIRMLANRLSLASSNIGGMAETQEMLDFCAKHGVTADIELISIDQIDAAFDRMAKGDVKYRFVIDMASLKSMPFADTRA